jgi:hypothetical protein
MRKALPIALLAVGLNASDAAACDCFGNDSYCATLDPSWFVNPVSTVLAVKLTDYYYGITVKVVQVLGGQQLPDDTLTVWGDNGALCRVNLNAFAIGDTVVFGLNECDLWGNTITAGFPPDLEQPGDYQVSVCGIYWLNYANGYVSGQITAPVFQNMTLAAFTAAIQNCSSANAISEVATLDPLVVRYVGGVPVLEMAGQSGTVELLITDVQGRMIFRRAWSGQALPFNSAAPGLYNAQVSIGMRRWARKLLVTE